MKKTTLLLLFVWLNHVLFAQDAIPAMTHERFRVYDQTGAFERLEPGTALRIEGYDLRPIIGNSTNVRLLPESGGKVYLASPKAISELAFDMERLSLEQIWELEFLRSEALEEIGKNGWDYDIREELEEERAEMERQFSFFTDPYLHDYLSRLLLRIHPGELPAQHPGSLRVRIIRSPTPQAFASAGGAIYLSTGMLATLGSEAELAAILAQEVAHIVLDHSVVNFRNMEQRQARAEFWAGLLTVAAAVGETVAITNAYENGHDPFLYYNVGGFTESVSMLAFSVAYEVAGRLGMEYTADQQMESAEIARQALRKLSYDENALMHALFRIREYYSQTRNEQAMRQDIRLNYFGAAMWEMGWVKELPPVELAYTRHTSLVNLTIASQEFALGRYDRARELAQRHIDAGVAGPEDYILMSAIQRRTSDEEEGMSRALLFLQQAAERARSLPNEFYIEKALVHLRRGQKAEALAALETYQERDPYRPVSSREESPLQWWVRNMLEKVERM